MTDLQETVRPPPNIFVHVQAYNCTKTERYVFVSVRDEKTYSKLTVSSLEQLISSFCSFSIEILLYVFQCALQRHELFKSKYVLIFTELETINIVHSICHFQGKE